MDMPKNTTAGPNKPREREMSISDFYVEESAQLVKVLSRNSTEGAVARKLRVTISTLQSLKKGRLKSVSAVFWARLNNAVADELRAEIRHLERHIEMVDQNVRRAGPGQMAAMAAQLEAMKKLLKERGE